MDAMLTPAPSGEEQPQPTPPQPRRRSLWRNRDYMLLWSGQTVSSVGTQVSQLAFPLLVLALTGSPAQAGIAGALRALPYVFFSLPVGALIDRWDRKRVMILCDIGRALALGSIPVAMAFSQLTVVQLFAVALVEGTLFVFFNLAEVACLPRVVTKEQLPAATATNSATEGTSALVGPSLGGALFAFSSMLPFVVDAISYAASFLSLFFIRTRFQGERTAQRRNLWTEIGEGIAWLWHQPLIRYIAFLTGGYNFISAGTPLILIVLATQQRASPTLIGLIFTIGGIGGIIGAFIAAPLQKRLSFAQVIVGITWISALTFPLYAVAPNPIVLGVITAVAYTLGPIYNVVQFSHRLSLIPDALQGRVNSVFRLLAFGFQPLGALLTGIMLQTLQPVPTVLLLSVVFLALAISASLNQHVRHAQSSARASTAA
ncbi:MAG TPA: MFS transporter [Ktedonobacterales bacterium]